MIRRLVNWVMGFFGAASVDTPLRQARQLKEVAHQLGIELTFHVRHLRTGLKRAEYKGTTLLTTPNPGEAWVLLRKLQEENADVGHYYVAVEARIEGFEITPEDIARRPARKGPCGVHAVAPSAAEDQPDLPLPGATEAAHEGAGAGSGSAGEPPAHEAVGSEAERPPVAGEGKPRLDVSKLLTPPLS